MGFDRSWAVKGLILVYIISNTLHEVIFIHPVGHRIAVGGC